MQRYFVPEENWFEEYVIISGKDVHHITRVMRNVVADKLVCIHPDGNAAICVIEQIGEAKITLNIFSWSNENHELPIEVTIVQSLPRGSKLELILQKSTELGVSRIQLYQADRSVTKWQNKKSAHKIKRYEKILKEASEQSARNKIPEIIEPINLKKLLDSYVDIDFILYAYEEEAKRSTYNSFSKVLKKVTPGNRVVIFIGPEGGFSEEEVNLFNSYKTKSVRLGKRILRTETASLYALSAISYHLEELAES